MVNGQQPADFHAENPLRNRILPLRRRVDYVLDEHSGPPNAPGLVTIVSIWGFWDPMEGEGAFTRLNNCFSEGGGITSPARRSHRYLVVHRRPRGRIRQGSQVRTHYQYRPAFICIFDTCCQVYSPQWNIWLTKVYGFGVNRCPTKGARE